MNSTIGKKAFFLTILIVSFFIHVSTLSAQLPAALDDSSEKERLAMKTRGILKN